MTDNLFIPKRSTVVFIRSPKISFPASSLSVPSPALMIGGLLLHPHRLIPRCRAFQVHFPFHSLERFGWLTWLQWLKIHSTIFIICTPRFRVGSNVSSMFRVLEYLIFTPWHRVFPQRCPCHLSHFSRCATDGCNMQVKDSHRWSGRNVTPFSA